jgi:hypothetical protein
MRRGAEFSESVERRASRIGGALLFALAAYVVISAAYGLWMREGQEFSTPGLVIAVLAIPVMWLLAKAKIRVADQIGSRALRADAVESITCGYPGRRRLIRYRGTLIHEGPGLRTFHVTGFERVDSEPGGADQVVYFAVEMTAPADLLPVGR